VDRAGGISAIGGTPVVRLGHLADEGCAEVWVKMEGANPSGTRKRTGPPGELSAQTPGDQGLVGPGVFLRNAAQHTSGTMSVLLALEKDRAPAIRD